MTLRPQAEEEDDEEDVIAHVDEPEVEVEETDDVLGPVGSGPLFPFFGIFRDDQDSNRGNGDLQ